MTRLVGDLDTCPDCGQPVFVAIAACDSSRETRLVDYTPRPDGNLVLNADGVMVAREENLGAYRVRIRPGRRFMLHSTICMANALEVGLDQFTNWHALDDAPEEVLA